MTEDRGRMNDYTGRLSDELTDDTRGYTVGASDYSRTDENKSSDHIKADIEQTRNEMSQKINKIQERLDPTRLKEQAQETVRSAVSESTDALVNYVRDSAGDVGYTIVDTIKRNPLPAALVGFGLGWMIFKGFSNSSPDRPSNGSDYRQRYNGGRGRNDGYGYPQNGSQYRDQYGDQNRYAYEAGGERASQYQGGQYQGGQYQSGVRSPNSDFYPSSTQNPGYGKSADGGYDQQEQSRVGQAVQSVQDTANNVLDQARDTAGQLTGQAQETAQQAGQYVQDKVGQVREQASQLGEQAQQSLQYTGRQVQHTVESNPMPFGIAALVAGVLIGLALPETQAENQIMGEKRDQLMDNAQSVAQDVKQRMQDIVEEKMPEVKQTAQKVAEDLKQTGKAAADDIKQTLMDAGESAKQSMNDLAQTGKDTGQDVAQSISNQASTTATGSTLRTGSTTTLVR